MEFVVNEWLPEYFLPTATSEEINLLITFWKKFEAGYDKIVVHKEAAFYQKLERYKKQLLISEAKRFELIKRFRDTILQNSLKCRYIDEPGFVPLATLTKLNEEGTNFSSDTYLFEAAIHTESRLIITTDVKLHLQMKDDPVFRVVLLKEFLNNY